MKYRFGTPEWFAFMHGAMLARFEAFRARATPAEVEALEFSMAEIALDPPADIAGGADRCGWRCEIRHGDLRFSTDDLDGAACRVFVPYEALRGLAMYETTDAPENKAGYASLLA